MRASLLYIPIFLILNACLTQPKKSTPEKDDYLLKINDTKISADEFLYAYHKSNENTQSTESIDSYLDLYTDFKLKVEAAKKAGLDTTAAFRRELLGYLSEIKKPYLVDEQIKEELLRETYERLQTEVNASHILIPLPESANKSDSVAAYEKIYELRSKALADSSFASLAIKYSADPSAKYNKGNLGWFTAFQMVYPFEEAAYSTEIGEISDVIRTRFGLHILKVHDKRETLGRIRIAHLMLRFPPNASKEDSVVTMNKMKAIKKQLSEGESWFKLVAKHSEDLNTREKGGLLPWFGAGSLPTEMEEAAYKLDKKGDISPIVKSPYGLHILKLEEKRGVGSFESMRESLINRIKRDGRADLKLTEVIGKLKNQNNFQKNITSYAILKQKSFDPENYSKRELEMPVFYIGQDEYTIESFLTQSDSTGNIQDAILDYENQMILKYENEHLEEKYPDYRYLSNEYYDGLLLFEIMSKKIWSLPGKDTILLRKYYDDNQSNYRQEKIYQIELLQLEDSSFLRKYKLPINGFYPFLDSVRIDDNFVHLRNRLLKKSDQPVSFQLLGNKSKIMELGDSVHTLLKSYYVNLNELSPFYSDENRVYLRLLTQPSELLESMVPAISKAEVLKKEAGEKIAGVEVSDNILKKVVRNNLGQLQWVNLKSTGEERLLTFEEAKVEVIADYQQAEEKKWLDSLKEIYEIHVNEKKLQEIKNSINAVE